MSGDFLSFEFVWTEEKFRENKSSSVNNYFDIWNVCL